LEPISTKVGGKRSRKNYTSVLAISGAPTNSWSCGDRLHILQKPPPPFFLLPHHLTC